MNEFRHSLRGLLKQPGFSSIAVLTLTLGIGANTAIFSLVYHVLLRPSAFPDAGRLVFVWNSYPKAGGEPSDVSIPDYLDRRAESPAIEDATLFTARPMTLSEGSQPEQLVGLAVTPSFFATLRRNPLMGRPFREEDARPGSDRVVILTYALWTSHFAADPGVVGRNLRINGETYLVTGVLPRDFELPVRQVALLAPFTFTSAQTSDMERGNEFSQMIARLRPGATVGQLESQMRTIVDRLMVRVPARSAYMKNTGFTGIAVPLRDQLSGDVKTWLYLLQAGVMVLLLISCGNVANLLLMRASGRQHELAVRAALGAGRWRLTRQLLTEGAVLSLLGAIAGIALAAAGVRGLFAMMAQQLPESAPAVIDPAVLAFTAGVAALTALVFGAAPALPMGRANLAAALKRDGARGSAGKRAGVMRTALAIAETALAVVLLIAAGLLVKGFTRLVRVDPGFSPDHVLSAQISLPPARYASAAAKREFWARLIEKSRAVPGISAVGLTSSVPFSGHPSSGSFTVGGRPLGPGEKPPHARQDIVSGDYFRAAGIPLLQGQLFDSTVTESSPRVALIDEFLARRQFPHGNALGQQLNFGSPRNYTIVGVVGTINDSDLAKPVPEGRIYLSAAQIPVDSMGIVLRPAPGAEAMAGAAIRSAVQSVDPGQAIADVRTMEQWIGQALSGRRTPMTLLTIFGAVALLLSAIGIYGVLAFSVAQRARELAIRQALGAGHGMILTLVLRQGLRTAAVGIGVGVFLATLLTGYMKSLLFSVQPLDPGVFAAVGLLLFTVAGVACYIPARRAIRIDPVTVLRE
jgi:predicted permease